MTDTDTNKESMKELLKQMFQGWIIREESYVPPSNDRNFGSYTKSPDQAMVEACEGDEIRGQLLQLFGHWSNDIQCLSAHYGIALERDNAGKLFVNENVMESPGPDHYWDLNTYSWKPIPDYYEDCKHTSAKYPVDPTKPGHCNFCNAEVFPKDQGVASGES